MSDALKHDQQPITVADLCLAINAGRLSANLDGDCYALSVGDLVRWARQGDEAPPVLRRAS